MKIIAFVLIMICCLLDSYGQTCTVVGAQFFSTIGTAPCTGAGESGTVGTSGATKVILDGSLTTTGNNQTVSGYSIEIADGGSININHNGAEIGGSIKVKDGADLNLEGGLSLPSGATLGIEDGGMVDSGTSGSDKLIIGGTTILKGNGSCTVADGSEDTDPPYCSSSGITGPTGFDENGETPSVLPIVLSFFNALVLESSIELNWETISEENFDFFSIERSEDGENFYEIGVVPGNGNSTERIQYSYVDTNPVFGTSFYRLNAIDFDGSYEKFQSISIEYVPNELSISLYPNPGNGKDMSIQLGLPTGAKLKTVKIYNFSGDLVLHKELKVGKNNLYFERLLPKGLYYAKIQIDNYSMSKKLVIN